MANYKVPQDVEAEDKLVGPFGLKQFIFILLFFAAGWMAYLLGRIALPLAVSMLPFLAIFGVLGFVQRRDQPVEVYLAALVRYYFKPHSRKWDQEGYEQRVIITAPKKIELRRVRNITLGEVHSRLNNLSRLMDSRGWAAKGLVTTPSDRLVQPFSPQGKMESAVGPDILSDRTQRGRRLDQLIEEQTQSAKEEAIKHMHEIKSPPKPKATDESKIKIPPNMRFSPYPKMHQKVIPPLKSKAKKRSNSQADKISPEVLRLANSRDRSVSSIAKEAQSLSSEEVVVPLR